MSPYKSPALSYFEWQQPVLDRLAVPPGGETKGDRYLILVGEDAWVGEDGNIATYNGAGWDFTDKKEGMVVYVMDENLIYLYIAAWVAASVTALTNLTDLAVVRGDGGAKGVKTSTMFISNLGVMTNISQPAFLAYLPTSDPDETGDGTVYIIGDKIDLTELYDRGGHFNPTTGFFTAPVTGLYLFYYTINYSNVGVAHVNFLVWVSTSNRDYIPQYGDCRAMCAGTGGNLAVSGSVLADMDANDTCYLRTTVQDGTKIVDIIGHVNDPKTYFSGTLTC